MPADSNTEAARHTFLLVRRLIRSRRRMTQRRGHDGQATGTLDHDARPGTFGIPSRAVKHAAQPDDAARRA